MRKSRFTDNLIMAMLKQNEDGVAVDDIYRTRSVSSAQFYNWRSKYCDMDTSMINYLKELKEENNRVKKRYAVERLISTIGKEALEKNGLAILAKRDGPQSNKAVLALQAKCREIE